jgi:recombination protein RecA
MKIGVMFGNPETTTGGQALKFYSSVRMDIRRIEAIKSGQDSIGMRARVKIVKNKVAPPFRQAEFDIMYNEGISVAGNVLDVATDLGIVRKTGAWFYLGEERLGQGRENAKEFLKHNQDVLEDIRNRIKAASPELSGRIAFDGHEGGAVPAGVGTGANGLLDEDEDLM